jgi:hypothetical protein
MNYSVAPTRGATLPVDFIEELSAQPRAMAKSWPVSSLDEL